MEQKKFWGRFSLLLVPFLLCIIWVMEIKRDFLPYTDQQTRFLVDRVKETGVYDFFRFLTNFGSTFFIIPLVVCIGVLLLFMYRDYLPSVVFCAGVIVTSLLNTIVKVIVARQRPSINIGANAEGYSFPSGHSAVSMVCYGLLAYFIMKKTSSKLARRIIAGVCLLLILGIGISRFFINVHYLTDILTGFFLGGMVLLGTKRLYEKCQRQRTQPQD